MSPDPWSIGLFFVLVLALFFYLGLRIIWAALSGMATLLGFGRARRAAAGTRGRGVGSVGTPVCPNPHCRRPTLPTANYCAQCGQRLRA
jgi:hypothetical protein